jgi:hypothetical protein
MNYARTTRDLRLQEHFGMETKLVRAGTRVLITGVAHCAGNLISVSNAEVYDVVNLNDLKLEEK